MLEAPPPAGFGTLPVGAVDGIVAEGAPGALLGAPIVPLPAGLAVTPGVGVAGMDEPLGEGAGAELVGALLEGLFTGAWLD